MQFKEFLEKYPSEESLSSLLNPVLKAIQENQNLDVFLLNVSYSGYCSFLERIILESKKSNIDYTNKLIKEKSLLSQIVDFILISIDDPENLEIARNHGRAACINMLLLNEANPNLINESEFPLVFKIKKKILELKDSYKKKFLFNILENLKRHNAHEFSISSLNDFLTNYNDSLSTKETIQYALYLCPAFKLGEAFIKNGHSKGFSNLLLVEPQLAMTESHIFLLEKTTFLAYSISCLKQNTTYKFELDSVSVCEKKAIIAAHQLRIINLLVTQGAALNIVTTENTVFGCIRQKKQSLILQLISSILNLRNTSIQLHQFKGTESFQKRINHLILDMQDTVSLILSHNRDSHDEETAEEDIIAFKQMFQSDSLLLSQIHAQVYDLGPITLAKLCIEKNFSKSFKKIILTYKDTINEVAASSLAQSLINQCYSIVNHEFFDFLSFESILMNIETLLDVTMNPLTVQVCRALFLSKKILLERNLSYPTSVLDDLIKNLLQRNSEELIEFGISFSSMVDFENKFASSASLINDFDSVILNYDLRNLIYYSSLKGYKDFLEKIIEISPELIQKLKKSPKEKDLHEIITFFLLDSLLNSTFKGDIHPFIQTIKLLLIYSRKENLKNQTKILAKIYAYQKKSPRNSVCANVAIYLQEIYDKQTHQGGFDYNMSLSSFQEHFSSDSDCLENYYYLSYLLKPSKLLDYCVQSDYIETINYMAETEKEHLSDINILVDSFIIESIETCKILISSKEKSNISLAEKKILILKIILKMDLSIISDQCLIDALNDLIQLEVESLCPLIHDTIEALIEKHNYSINFFTRLIVDHSFENFETEIPSLSSLNKAFLQAIETDNPTEFRNLLSIYNSEALLTPLTQDSSVFRHLYAHLFSIASRNSDKSFTESSWISVLEETLDKISHEQIYCSTIQLILQDLETACSYMSLPDCKKNLNLLKSITVKHSASIQPNGSRFVTKQQGLLFNLIRNNNQRLISLVFNRSAYFTQMTGLFFADLAMNIFDAPIEVLKIINPCDLLLTHQKMHLCSYINTADGINFLKDFGFNVFINQTDMLGLLPVFHHFDRPTVIQSLIAEGIDLLAPSEFYPDALTICIEHQKTQSIHFFLEVIGPARPQEHQPLELILKNIRLFNSLEILNIFISTQKKLGFNLLNCFNSRGGPIHWAVNTDINHPLLREGLILLNELIMNKNITDQIEGLNSCEKYFGHTYDLIVSLIKNEDIENLWEKMIESLQKAELPTKKRRTLLMSTTSEETSLSFDHKI